jgi:hypothetical protein
VEDCSTYCTSSKLKDKLGLITQSTEKQQSLSPAEWADILTLFHL